MMIGKTAKAAPAINIPMSMLVFNWSASIPRKMVKLLLVVSTIDCREQSFQELISLNIANVPMPGFTIGTKTVVKVLNSLAPSILAGSSISPGMPSENCLIRNTPKGSPQWGR